MPEYQIFRIYLEVLWARLGDVRTDERGLTDLAVLLVVVGASILGAVVIVNILWNKLKSGAEDLVFPTPAAP